MMRTRVKDVWEDSVPAYMAIGLHELAFLDVWGNGVLASMEGITH